MFGASQEPHPQDRRAPVIAIVGGGFAGVAVARRLERRLRRDEAAIVLFSRENYSLFTPMLPEVTSGELEVRHVVTPIRQQLARTAFVLAEVEAIDVERRTVAYRHALTGNTDEQSYDHLVLALGSSTSSFGIPGVDEHTWALKTLDDADALRNHLVWLLELGDTLDDPRRRDRLLRLVVVGGGFTGVETAGEIVENVSQRAAILQPPARRSSQDDSRRSWAGAARRSSAEDGRVLAADSRTARHRSRRGRRRRFGRRKRGSRCRAAGASRAKR